MSDVLARIKRAVVAKRYKFSEKAHLEMDRDDLTEADVVESILHANRIQKTIRSTSPLRGYIRELLYVIISSQGGELIYTKGKLVRLEGQEVFYFLISSKRAE